MDYQKFAELSPTAYGDVLPREHFISHNIQSLWNPAPRIAGPAFTVQMTPGEHLMMHVAIYKAPKGSIIVADAGDCSNAVAGGNVCATAQQRGIAGFVVDGVIRDLKEIRDSQFPVYAQGVFPVPGAKKEVSPLNQPITCGGVSVSAGDVIVADEEGIVVIPNAIADDVYLKAKAKAEKDEKMSLEDWQDNHYARISEAYGDEL